MKIVIDGWKAGITFSACHFIPRHEKCGRLHGHTYAVSAKIKGKPELGFLMDFSDVKTALREVAGELDHKVILPGNSSDVQIGAGDEIEVHQCGKRYVFPAEDVVILDISVASAEELARHCAARMGELLGGHENIKKIKVQVDEGPGQGATGKWKKEVKKKEQPE